MRQKRQKKVVSKNTEKEIIKNKLKLKRSLITLFEIQCRFQNFPCFFLALIVFDFYSFEIYIKKDARKK